MARKMTDVIVRGGLVEGYVNLITLVPHQRGIMGDDSESEREERWRERGRRDGGREREGLN